MKPTHNNPWHVIQPVHSKARQTPRVLSTCAETQRRSTGRSTEPSQAHNTAIKLPIVGISTSTWCVGMMEYNYHNAPKARDASSALIQLGLNGNQPTTIHGNHTSKVGSSKRCSAESPKPISESVRKHSSRLASPPGSLKNGRQITNGQKPGNPELNP